jgi:hypothetical protein
MRSRIGTSRSRCINHEDLDLAYTSLNAIADMHLSDFERTYWCTLMRVVQNAYERPVETYTTFVLLYNIPSQWTHDEFRAFMDPSNAVAQILLAHFIAVQAVLMPILYLERVGFQGVNAPTCVVSWIEGIYTNVPSHFRRYVEWPRQVSQYPLMRFFGQRQIDDLDEEELQPVVS